LYLFKRRAVKQIVVILEAYLSLLLVTYRILPSILLSRLTPYAGEITGDHHCGF
jgi:hypothetical protein